MLKKKSWDNSRWPKAVVFTAWDTLHHLQLNSFRQQTSANIMPTLLKAILTLSLVTSSKDWDEIRNSNGEKKKKREIILTVQHINLWNVLGKFSAACHPTLEMAGLKGLLTLTPLSRLNTEKYPSLILIKNKTKTDFPDFIASKTL